MTGREVRPGDKEKGVTGVGPGYWCRGKTYSGGQGYRCRDRTVVRPDYWCRSETGEGCTVVIGVGVKQG